jgi:hypothetical protein
MRLPLSRIRCGGRQRSGEPVENRCGDVAVFRQEMAGAFEAVHVGVRKPGEEVLEVPVRKDGIPGAPEHQRRDPQPAQPFRHAAERREAGVGRVHGNVRHKVPHPGGGGLPGRAPCRPCGSRLATAGVPTSVSPAERRPTSSFPTYARRDARQAAGPAGYPNRRAGGRLCWSAPPRRAAAGARGPSPG